MYRINIFILCLAFCAQAFSQANVTDGPYVFYGDQKIYIESVTGGKVSKDSMFLNNRKRIAPLQVAVGSIPGLTFTVPLKKELSEERSEYPAATNLFVISDIEGTFQNFTRLLQTAKVINNKMDWTYGPGHLVVCGDVFDRGEEVTATLWLLYKLEEEARKQGGHVHLILGNHEIMNLSEDFRYVHNKYSEAAGLLNRPYYSFFTPDTELGRWLRTKNVMEKIGSWLFLHGGVSQVVNQSGLSLKKINQQVRPYYDKDGLDSILMAGGVMPFFNGETSPFWYRGYFTPPLASMAQVDSTLRLYKVDHIVVGHTIVDSVRTLYNGKVIAIDVNNHKGSQQALLIEGTRYFRLHADGRRTELQ